MAQRHHVVRVREPPRAQPRGGQQAAILVGRRPFRCRPATTIDPHGSRDRLHQHRAARGTQPETQIDRSRHASAIARAEPASNQECGKPNCQSHVAQRVDLAHEAALRMVGRLGAIGRMQRTVGGPHQARMLHRAILAQHNGPDGSGIRLTRETVQQRRKPRGADLDLRGQEHDGVAPRLCRNPVAPFQQRGAGMQPHIAQIAHNHRQQRRLGPMAAIVQHDDIGHLVGPVGLQHRKTSI